MINARNATPVTYRRAQLKASPVRQTAAAHEPVSALRYSLVSAVATQQPVALTHLLKATRPYLLPTTTDCSTHAAGSP